MTDSVEEEINGYWKENPFNLGVSTAGFVHAPACDDSCPPSKEQRSHK